LESNERQETFQFIGGSLFFPLTHPQKRIWYMEKLYPDTSLYNIGGPSRIKGRVDLIIMDRAIRIFIKKNEGIRLQFFERDGEVFQKISEYDGGEIDFFDFSQSEKPEMEYNNWIEKEIQKKFKLIASNLYYFALFKISDIDRGIFIRFHHIISDGWSVNIASEQIFGIYEKLLKGEDIGEDVEYSYIEYIANEQKYLNSDRFLKNRAFWINLFEELPEPIMPNNTGILTGSRKTCELECGISQKIKELVSENKCSINTFFVTLFLIYLYKITQHNDIVIGTPVLNRSTKREKSIFGMFTSTMPFRFQMDDRSTVIQMMKKVNTELLNYYFHQKYPYDLLVQDIELKKRGCDSLFQICVNYYNTSLNKELDGFSVENMELYNGNQLYSLELVIKDWTDRGSLTLDFNYHVADYTQAQIDSMLASMFSLAGQVLNDPSVIICGLDVLTESEKRCQTVDFNLTDSNYPKEETIIQLIEQQVKKTPDNIAVYFNDIKLTYAELNKRSNQLAKLLRDKGVSRDTIVGLMVTHSVEAVVGILGIIKSGGAYLPVDPDYPSDRTGYMLEDSGCRILLTNCRSGYESGFRGEIIDLEDEGLYSGGDADPAPVNGPRDLVYVIYTSGSTGKPKGVMIEHMGLLNYIWWARKMYVRDMDDAFALYSSLSFDLTVTSVFTPLICGNSIYIYRDDGQEYVLFRIMKEKKASVIKLTPSHLSLLKELDNRDSSVKRFIVGGEDLKVSLATAIHNSFGGNIEIYNEYGPTETVVGCMIHRFDNGRDTAASVPIGVPADNVQIYILDKDLKPLPAGYMGEMYISGDGVARGYIHRKDLTEERFVSNPYKPGHKMYRTGDLAKFLDNGRIEYCGRADQQIKIRGYRIELGEIERHISDYGLINNAVVIDREECGGGKYLCAYIVPDGDISADSLREYLSKRLPEYMVPVHFIIMDEIPLTKNGKVNKNLLPVPACQESGTANFAAPGNDREEKLLEVVAHILNKPDMGMKDNFIYHGGDSIKAIQVAAKLNEAGLSVRVRDILSNPVIEEMALCIEKHGDRADYMPCKGSFKPTPVMLWFFSQNFQVENHYNQSVLLDFKREISAIELGMILDGLIRHHDSLRLNYDIESGEMYYNNNFLELTNRVELFDLSGFGRTEQEQQIRQLGSELKSNLDIGNKVPIKACIFNLGARGRRILFTAHHLVMDGISWRVLLEDFARLYEYGGEDGAFVLPGKTQSIMRWANKLQEYAKAEAIGQIEYWNQIAAHDFVFPADYDSEGDSIDNSTTYTENIDEDETRLLLHDANRAFGTEPYELMLAALVLAVGGLCGSSEVVMELEGHGREELFADIDISRTVGWFTSIYPVVLKKYGQDLSVHIKAVKEQLRCIPDKGLGFGILKYLTDALPDSHKKHIRFNYLGEADNISYNHLFGIAGEDSGSESSGLNHMTSLIDINLIILNKRLNVNYTYSKLKFLNETICRLSQRFLDHLREIIYYCSSKSWTEYTPSDFDMVKFSQDELDQLVSKFETR
jgi:amino acid adenylation domain-containing protein/non-ribosomal peptide synthase protein (TIGR01720 family)